jgi:hypothetical protein
MILVKRHCGQATLDPEDSTTAVADYTLVPAHYLRER